MVCFIDADWSGPLVVFFVVRTSRAVYYMLIALFYMLIALFYMLIAPIYVLK